jgi:putative endonuclease
MRAHRSVRGALGEQLAAEFLLAMGWQLLRRNLRLARDEIDLLAIDPHPPGSLVLVEVRSLQTAAFGAPEERVDRAKVRRLYRAAARLRASLPAGARLARLPIRVDLIVVDRRFGRTDIRHLRGLEPP